MDTIDRNKYKIFSPESIIGWGNEHYKNWLHLMQNQKNLPNTPLEKFFKFYTQGIDYVFNDALRYDKNIEEYFSDSFIQPEMFYAAIKEISNNRVSESIVTYRYINKEMFKSMLKWSRVRYLKKGVTIYDKGFLSTTLTPMTVRNRKYVDEAMKILTIYVPKDTPCVFLELIADMQENELLFAPRTKLKIISACPFTKSIECVIESEC